MFQDQLTKACVNFQSQESIEKNQAPVCQVDEELDLLAFVHRVEVIEDAEDEAEPRKRRQQDSKISRGRHIVAAEFSERKVEK